MCSGIYHHKIQTKRTALLYYTLIVVILQKDIDFYNSLYKTHLFPFSYKDININDGNIFLLSPVCYINELV